MGKYDFEFDLFENSPLAWIARTIPKEATVLEFGAANGRLTKYLKEEKECSVDIVEIDGEAGQDAAKYAVDSYVGEEQGDILKYHWLEKGKQYDYIVFADVLEHLARPEEVLHHCQTSLNKKGKILVSVPNISHNSVIINLFNDKFDYNSVGLLDNTHIKFFTRGSFLAMAAQSGYVVVEEKVKSIRVGETEIPNSYCDVPRSVFKELIARDAANAYQYMFVLASKDEYLNGEIGRTVELDRYTYYNSDVTFGQDGVYDYKKSSSKGVNPHDGFIKVESDIMTGCMDARVRLLDCNCIIKDVIVRFCDQNGEWRDVEVPHNGATIGDKIYFLECNPVFFLTFAPGDTKFSVSVRVLEYDFDATIIKELVELTRSSLAKENNVNNKLCSTQALLQIKTEEADRSLVRVVGSKAKNKLRKVYRKVVGKDRVKKPAKKVKIDIYSDANRSYPKVQGNLKEVVAVIPNYNYEQYLDERIDSILFQTYPVKELIILDDCSKDNSVELIKRRIANNDSGIPITFIPNETNSGNVFSQWQKAFASAKGDYVWIAEADDSCDARFLETVMKGFDDEDVVISYCESLTVDEENNLLMSDLREWIDIYHTGKWNQDYIKDGKEEVAETMCINNTLANASSAVFKNGDYHEILEGAKSFRLAGDWYTYMSILMRGKIAYFKDSYNFHRMQDKGVTLSTSHEKEFEEIVRLQNFAMENFDVSEDVKVMVYRRREEVRTRFGL